ncbi:hypothetical protein LPICM17_290012 [Lactococcus piscium]|nr:hypothetical protein LPICM17_290012 [Lactococcus piscium]
MFGSNLLCLTQIDNQSIKYYAYQFILFDSVFTKCYHGIGMGEKKYGDLDGSPDESVNRWSTKNMDKSLES